MVQINKWNKWAITTVLQNLAVDALGLVHELRFIYSRSAIIPSSTLSNMLPDSKIHGANMGPNWGRQDPGGPHVGPMNIAIWVDDAWFALCFIGFDTKNM